MRITYCLFALLCIFTGCNSYASSLDQKKKLHVQVHNYEEEIILHANSTATLKRFVDATIYNDQRHNHINYTRFFYDEDRKINNLFLEISDVNGKSIQKIKKKDFIDQAAYDGISLFSDNRILFYRINNISSPYRLKVTLEMELKQIMNVPAFFPIKDAYTGLSKAKFTVICPEGKDIFYRNTQIDDPEIKTIDDGRAFIWRVNKIEPIQKLSNYDCPFIEVVPWVDWVPSSFAYGGASGGYSTWSEFAGWLAKLNSDVGDLPQDAIDEVRRLVNPSMSMEEKIRIIYTYLQQRSRYVSVQLGVGGFKPFDAKTVHATQYGDCKALSNYMKSLLAQVGVPSFYTVIRAGKDEQDGVQPDFPSNSFNHAVLLVPVEKDTIVLECTSQNSPCGYRSSFTDHRYALAIGEDGGQLIKTPGYGADENWEKDSVRLDLAEDGSAYLKSYSEFGGSRAELYGLMDLSESDQINYLIDYVDFGQFDIEHVSMELVHKPNWDYTYKLNTELRSSNFASRSGNRIFISPTVFHDFTHVPSEDSVQYGFRLTTSVDYFVDVYINIPVGCVLESALFDEKIESIFGSYTIKYELQEQENVLKVSRNYSTRKGRFDKAAFHDYKAYRKKIKKLESADIVFVQK